MNHNLPFRNVLAVCCLIRVLFLICISDATLLHAQEKPHEVSAIFDSTIAPLLARHCVECHSAANKGGGLDLTRRDTAFPGGENGKAIVPGDAESSLLWQYVESDTMPKKRSPLSNDEKQAIRSWIEKGAEWGDTVIDGLSLSTDRRAGFDWWSLRPVQRLEPPQVKNESWCHNPIDRFVLASLEANDMQPAQEADRRTLIRRLTFDLIGLPPEPEAVEKFVNDSSDQAYATLVNQLLESPHYGERWARHWLDVVRFGETQGFERNRIRQNAWRYRDYVIESFNKDLPFNDFVRQQIAGDVLYPGDYNALIATGYHVCGTWDQVGHFEGSQTMRVAAREDHLEDLVGTLGQAFLGLTINCSRCHDHKFDPVSQQNYYEFAALLGGVTQQKEEHSEINASRDRHRQDQLEGQLGDVSSQLQDLENRIRQSTVRNDGKREIDGLQLYYLFDQKPVTTTTANTSTTADTQKSESAIADLSHAGDPIDLLSGPPGKFFTLKPPYRFLTSVKNSGELTVEVWITPGNMTQIGPARILTISKDSGQRNFTLGQDGPRFDVRLRTTKTDKNGMPSLASAAPTLAENEGPPQRTHVVSTFDGEGTHRLYVNGRQTAERRTGGSLKSWSEDFQLVLGDELSGGRAWAGKFHVVALYSKSLSQEQIALSYQTGTENIRAAESLNSVLMRASEDERLHCKELLARQRDLSQQLDAVRYVGPAHIVIPQQPPVFHVLARGDPQQRLQSVTPGGLTALKMAGFNFDFDLSRDAPDSARRVKLAEWLSSAENPLPARVFVNRLWYYHFGRGIVDTPSDFGFNGGRPSHPELLDWLASELIEQGWSIKAMHRLIVTSAAYRQSSLVDNDSAKNRDADNRLLWRANVRRLEGELVRDSVLAVAGELNRQTGGPSFRDVKVSGGVMDTNSEFTVPTAEFSDEVNRRTIYRLWARSGNHPLLQSLDCPDPSVMAPTRTRTITPVQSLALLNNPLMQQASEKFAERVVRESGNSADRQIDTAWRLAFGRPPGDAENIAAGRFVAEQGLPALCLVLLNSNEFLFIN